MPPGHDRFAAQGGVLHGSCGAPPLPPPNLPPHSAVTAGCSARSSGGGPGIQPGGGDVELAEQ